MSILRVGPWGNLDEWYKPEPFDTTIDSIYYPINCALEDWPSQTWACFAITDVGFAAFDPEYIYSKADLGEVISRTDEAGQFGYTPTVVLVFCYQATEEFNVNLNWEFTGATSDNYPFLDWAYSTIDGDSGSYHNTPGDSGTEIIVLPPATLGIVRAVVQGYLTDFTKTLTTNASFSKP
tara:strand:- start:206 stop:742 length:537 start_codon:yes stop_codon:yes gene_type:complete